MTFVQLYITKLHKYRRFEIDHDANKKGQQYTNNTTLMYVYDSHEIELIVSIYSPIYLIFPSPFHLSVYAFIKIKALIHFTTHFISV